jgi:hypothetical protein
MNHIYLHHITIRGVERSQIAKRGQRSQHVWIHGGDGGDADGGGNGKNDGDGDDVYGSKICIRPPDVHSQKQAEIQAILRLDNAWRDARV